MDKTEKMLAEIIKKTAEDMGPVKLQEIRDRDNNWFELRCFCADIGISGFDFDRYIADMHKYHGDICVPYLEVGQFVLATDRTAMEYDKWGHLKFVVIVVNRDLDIMKLDSNAGMPMSKNKLRLWRHWDVPIKNYKTVPELITTELGVDPDAHFRGFRYRIAKKKEA